MTIEDAIKINPYNAKKGNKSAYARYLRYTVTGFYNLTNGEVRKKWEDHIDTRSIKDNFKVDKEIKK